MTSLAMCTKATYPEEDQDDDDAHDQKAALDREPTLHDLTNGLCNADGTLTDDDDSEQTHALHQMGFLEAEHAPKAGDGNHTKGFQDHHDVPNEVHQPLRLVIGLEGRGHTSKYSGSDGVDSDHQAEREI